MARSPSSGSPVFGMRTWECGNANGGIIIQATHLDTSLMGKYPGFDKARYTTVAPADKSNELLKRPLSLVVQVVGPMPARSKSAFYIL